MLYMFNKKIVCKDSTILKYGKKLQNQYCAAPYENISQTLQEMNKSHDWYKAWESNSDAKDKDDGNNANNMNN